MNIEKKTKSNIKKAEYLFQSFPDFHITKETKKDILQHPEKYSGLDIRIRMGLFYTDEEKEQYISKSLSRPMPGKQKKYIFKKRKQSIR